MKNRVLLLSLEIAGNLFCQQKLYVQPADSSKMQWFKEARLGIFIQRGIPPGHFYGPTTLSKDKKTLYCFILDNPKAEVVIKGICNKIKAIRVLGSNQNLKFKLNGGASWLNIPPVLLIDLPADQLDNNTTMIAIELDTPVELYRGEGGAVEKN